LELIKNTIGFGQAIIIAIAFHLIALSQYYFSYLKCRIINALIFNKLRNIRNIYYYLLTYILPTPIYILLLIFSLIIPLFRSELFKIGYFLGQFNQFIYGLIIVMSILISSAAIIFLRQGWNSFNRDLYNLSNTYGEDTLAYLKSRLNILKLNKLWYPNRKRAFITMVIIICILVAAPVLIIKMAIFTATNGRSNIVIDQYTEYNVNIESLLSREKYQAFILKDSKRIIVNNPVFMSIESHEIDNNEEWKVNCVEKYIGIAYNTLFTLEKDYNNNKGKVDEFKAISLVGRSVTTGEEKWRINNNIPFDLLGDNCPYSLYANQLCINYGDSLQLLNIENKNTNIVIRNIDKLGVICEMGNLYWHNNNDSINGLTPKGEIIRIGCAKDSIYMLLPLYDGVAAATKESINLYLFRDQQIKELRYVIPNNINIEGVLLSDSVIVIGYIMNSKRGILAISMANGNIIWNDYEYNYLMMGRDKLNTWRLHKDHILCRDPQSEVSVISISDGKLNKKYFGKFISLDGDTLTLAAGYLKRYLIDSGKEIFSDPYMISINKYLGKKTGNPYDDPLLYLMADLIIDKYRLYWIGPRGYFAGHLIGTLSK
jgi:hypothetical protein